MGKLIDKELEIIDLSQIEGLSNSKLASLYNCSHNTIKKLLDNNNLKSRHKSGFQIGQKIRKKYTVNEAAFSDITNPEALYWAGFLLADGCINLKKGKYPRLQCRLSSVDREHLNKLKYFLNFTGPIRDSQAFDVRYNKIIYTSSIEINSGQIYNDLKMYGLSERKSLTAIPSEISIKSRDFWRGVLDGDGSLGNYPYNKLTLVGSKQTCDLFKEYCDKIVPDSKVTVRPTKNIYKVVYSGKNAATLVKHFYLDSLDYLDRKCIIARTWL